MPTVLHLAHRGEWDAADLQGDGYAPAAFAQEGFVHCSTAAQVLASAERHFAPDDDLLVLVLDEAALGDDLRWERAPSVGEDFPHLYRHIRHEDVVVAAPLARTADGWALPSPVLDLI